MTLHRETPARLGPHPHRSARASFGPHITFIHQLATYTSLLKSVIITTHHSTTTNVEKGASTVDQGPVETQDVSVSGPVDATTASSNITVDTSSGMDLPPAVAEPSGLSVKWADSVDTRSRNESVLQISGAGHWFLKGWIGDHSVDFLVDSGSAVTALSCSFYQTLVWAGSPVGALQAISRKLRGTNGSSIDNLGCSSCVVSFLGLQTGCPILVCDLSTDTIIGTDTLGSVLPHTLDIKNGLLYTEGGVSLQLHRMDAALSPWDTVRFPRILRRCFIAPHIWWVAGPCHPVAFWRVLPCLRITRPGGAPDTGEPVRMENSSSGI